MESNNIDRKFLKNDRVKKRKDKVTTIVLTLSQYTFLKTNNIDMSKLIRSLLEKFINGEK
jgi:hypothetical protein